MDNAKETVLDWFEVETADSAHWKAATPDGDYDVIDCGSLGVKWSGPTGYEADDWRTCATIKAAKDECENHAQRITSALVQPSGAVSDDLRKAAVELVQTYDFHVASAERGDEMWDSLSADLGVIIREKIKPALASPVSEGEISRAEHLAEVTELRERLHAKHSEIRADERERLAKLSEAEAYRLAAKTEAMSPTDYVGLNRLRDRATWLRSLTNGDG